MFSTRLTGLAFLVACTLALSGCATKAVKPALKKEYAKPLAPGAVALVRAKRSEIPDFGEGWAFRASLSSALRESQEYFQKPSSKEWFPYRTSDREITHADMVGTIDGLLAVIAASHDAREFNSWCRRAFDVYKSRGWDGSGEVLFTAYCEPVFDGRLQEDGEFRYPLYRAPKDLVKDEKTGKCLGRRNASGGIDPYPDRAELMASGVLRGLEIAWLRDPFECYIAQVQGSARVNLPDGRQLCLGYAAKNAHDYIPIAKILIKEGKIRRDELNLARLQTYFRNHPGEIDRVLPMNPSFVFFTEREPGPYGSLGTRVTPYHTLATDKDVFPRGGPCIAVTRLPREVVRGKAVTRRRALFALDQDRGGAIRSAGRADIFIGTGDEAEELAGYTMEEGRLFYLFLKPNAFLPHAN